MTCALRRAVYMTLSHGTADKANLTVFIFCCNMLSGHQASGTQKKIRHQKPHTSSMITCKEGMTFDSKSSATFARQIHFHTVDTQWWTHQRQSSPSRRSTPGCTSMRTAVVHVKDPQRHIHNTGSKVQKTEEAGRATIITLATKHRYCSPEWKTVVDLV
jgi:hypothetical protein